MRIDTFMANCRRDMRKHHGVMRSASGKTEYAIIRSGSSKLVEANELSTRVITAKTVNEELHSLRASCVRIQAKLDSVIDEIELGKGPGETRKPWPELLEKQAKLESLLARQSALLDILIGDALNGRKYRHRSGK